MNYSTGFAAICAALALAGVASAAEIKAVRAGVLIDPVSGKALKDQVILIEEGRVAAVGPAAAIVPPPGAETLDLSGHWVLPGLIDAHVHLTNDGETHGYGRLEYGVADATATAVAMGLKTLDAGFTTVRNLGDRQYATVAVDRAIERGLLTGPRIVSAGESFGATGGHCDDNLLPIDYKAVSSAGADGPWALRARVREAHKYGAEVIKICATGGVLSKGTTVGGQQLTEEEMSALVQEAKLLGLKVAAHAHGTEGIKAALRAGVSSIEHASLADEEAFRLAKASGAVFVMDVYVSDYILAEGARVGILPESLEKERQVGRAQRETFQRALKAGVPLAFGTDAGVYPHGLNARQFAFMVEWGMSPMQAIQAATVNGARLLGLEGKVGALAPGAYADFIAAARDPLADIRALESVPVVVKGGELVKDAR